MNQYRMCIVDQNLMDLVEKNKSHFPNFEKIKKGFTINASSKEEARNIAHKNYILMIAEDAYSAVHPPLVPEINKIGPGAWMNEKLTSCELVL